MLNAGPLRHLDVHKTTIAVAVADGGRSGEVRQLGAFANRADALRKMVERLERRGVQLRFCYEAGPCGYGLHRFLTGLGHACAVVAPSLIPIRARDRIKTDRRDAVMLARLHRAGELTEVWVPDAGHEAMRDLVRARATAARTLSKARQHLGGFLLRHGKIVIAHPYFEVRGSFLTRGVWGDSSLPIRLTHASTTYGVRPVAGIKCCVGRRFSPARDTK